MKFEDRLKSVEEQLAGKGLRRCRKGDRVTFSAPIELFGLKALLGLTVQPKLHRDTEWGHLIIQYRPLRLYMYAFRDEDATMAASRLLEYKDGAEALAARRCLSDPEILSIILRNLLRKTRKDCLDVLFKLFFYDFACIPSPLAMYGLKIWGIAEKHGLSYIDIGKVRKRAEKSFRIAEQLL